MKLSATVAIGLSSMVIGLLLMTAGVLLLALAPAQYEAAALVHVDKVTTNSANTSTTGFDPLWWENELKRAQSTPVLRAAITNLQLDQFWAKQQKRELPLSVEDAERELKQRIEVQSRRGTALIEISLRAYAPDEAARLANGVAEAFAADHSPKEATVEIVDSATPPGKPQRQKQPVTIILFLSGALLMVVGYVMLRPHLDKIGGSPVQRP